MNFEIEFYETVEGRKPAAEFLVELEFKNIYLRNRISEGINKLKNSIYHKEPLSKYIEPGLWELRIKAGTDIARILYTFRKGQIIILLHAFVKKQQKTPKGELNIARKRLKDILLREAN